MNKGRRQPSACSHCERSRCNFFLLFPRALKYSASPRRALTLVNNQLNPQKKSIQDVLCKVTHYRPCRHHFCPGYATLCVGDFIMLTPQSWFSDHHQLAVALRLLVSRGSGVFAKTGLFTGACTGCRTPLTSYPGPSTRATRTPSSMCHTLFPLSSPRY